MNFPNKKTIAGIAAVILTAVSLPFILSETASSATNNGTASLSASSGTGATNVSISLGGSASCPGDSNAGYRWQTFMIPAAADIDSTLTFNSSGPIAVSGQFRQPLFDTTGTPIVNKLTDIAVAPSTSGGISGIPAFNFNVYSPGDIPNGAYKIGVACTLGAASSTQLQSYWSRVITVTNDNTNTDPAKVDWVLGSVPSAPSITTVTPGDTQLTVAFAAVTGDPAVTSYSVSATPQGGGSAVTVSGSSSPLTLTGLTNGTTYNIVVTATNNVGTSSTSQQSTGVPAAPAPTTTTVPPPPTTVAPPQTPAPQTPAPQTPAPQTPVTQTPVTTASPVVSPAPAG